MKIKESTLGVRVLLAGVDMSGVLSFDISLSDRISGRVSVALGGNIDPSIRRYLGGAPIAIFVKDDSLAGDEWVLLAMGLVSGSDVTNSGGYSVLTLRISDELEFLSKISIDTMDPTQVDIKYGAPGISIIDIPGLSQMVERVSLANEISSSRNSLIRPYMKYIKKIVCSKSAQEIDRNLDGVMGLSGIENMSEQEIIDALLKNIVSGSKNMLSLIRRVASREIKEKNPFAYKFLSSKSGIDASIAMMIWGGIFIKNTGLENRFAEVFSPGYTSMYMKNLTILEILMNRMSGSVSSVFQILSNLLAYARASIFRFPFPVVAGQSTGGKYPRIVDRIISPVALFHPIPKVNVIRNSYSIGSGISIDLLNQPTHAFIQTQVVPGIGPIITEIEELSGTQSENSEQPDEDHSSGLSGIRASTLCPGTDMFFYGPGLIRIPTDPVMELLMGASSNINSLSLPEDAFSDIRSRVSGRRAEITKLYLDLAYEMLLMQSSTIITMPPRPLINGVGASIVSGSPKYFRPSIIQISHKSTENGQIITMTVRGDGYLVPDNSVKYSKLITGSFGIRSALSMYKDAFETIGTQFISGESHGSPSKDVEAAREFSQKVDAYLRYNYKWVTLDVYREWLNGVYGDSGILKVQRKLAKIINSKIINNLEAIYHDGS